MGVNLSGLELNPGQLPGRPSFDFVAPTEAEFAAAAAAGFTVIRLPVAWERLQPRRGATLDPAMLGMVRDACATAERHHLRVILDLHNYGSYRGDLIGSAALPNTEFAAFWGEMAHAFAGDQQVIFGLMNEPHGIDAAAWADAAQAAITEIRAAGARNLVLVSGTGWDGAHNFVSGDGYGAANAPALARVRDPANNMAFEVHQYLDSDFSGTHPDCVTPDAARPLIAPVTDWLRAHHQRGFLGETAATGTPDCLSTLAALLSAVDAAPDAWLGWAYWAGGPWWGDYMFSVEPKEGRDRPQMAVLRQLAKH